MPEVAEAPKTGGTRGFFLVRMGDPCDGLRESPSPATIIPRYVSGASLAFRAAPKHVLVRPIFAILS